VSLTSPAGGSTYPAPATVPLAASAADGDGSVSRVEFLANGTLVATDTTAPYSYGWGNVGAGTYNLVARATDDDGAVTSSAPVAITVHAPPPGKDGTGTGLSGQYFNTVNLTGSSTTRVDPRVDFAWGTGSPAATLNPDNFSIRWSGQLEPRFSETYTLSTISDDGVRLWLDGQLLLDHWNEHAETEDAVSVALVAGRRYDLKLEYFELSGAATARLLWSSASQPRQAVPPTQLYPAAAPPAPPANAAPSVSLTGPVAGSTYAAPAIVPLAASASDGDGSVSRVEFFANGTLIATDTAAPYAYSWTNVPAGSYRLTARATDDDGAATVSSAVTITVSNPPPPPSGSGTGLSGQYFDSPDFSGAPVVSRLDPQVDFSWGMGSPAAAVGADDFTARWTGELEARFSEPYTLSTISDDGVRVWLDGKLLIDSWSEHSAKEDAALVELAAGRRYPLKIEYFELGGAATARLLWSSPSQPKQVVPRSQLYPAAMSAPPAADTQPPSAPQGMSFTAKSQTSVTMSWQASTDNVGVTGYRLYRNGAQVGTTTGLTYTFSNLACGTSYTLAVEAFDAAGNASNRAEASGVVTTDGCATTPPPPPPPSGGGAGLFVSVSGSDAGSCSQAQPCRSFERAYRVASPGQVVEVAAGTYPEQSIPAVAGRVGPAVEFREAGRVILGGLDIEGDYVTVRGVETVYRTSAPGAGNQVGVWVSEASYVSLIDVDAGSVGSWKADHFTVRGGDYGPCDAVSGPGVCGNNKQDVSTDVLIEGAYFHDLEYDASAPGAHWECMYVNGGRNVTIRANRFERCAIFDLFVTISGPDAAALGHENLTIEGNSFASATNGLGTPSRGWSSLSLSWCQNASRQPAYRNVLIQGNDFDGGKAGIERDLNADAAGCTWSNVLVKANTLLWQGCQNGWRYEDNRFAGGTGCGPSNVRIG
jgi:chitodextrinase